MVNPAGKTSFSQLIEDFVGEKSFKGIYSKETANMLLVRSRVYTWSSGMYTII
jgi:hypothetical protein